LSVVVFAWGIPRFAQWMDAKTSVSIPVVGLHNIVVRVPPVAAVPAAEAAVFNLNWLALQGLGSWWRLFSPGF